MTQSGTKQERAEATAVPDLSSAVLEATGTTTLPERQFAATSWLLGAADDRDTARRQWDEQGIALLCCGGILSAVRIPARIVWAAAKSDELGKVDAFLARWFDGGAAFMDLHAQRYYALVPGTAGWRLRERDFPGVSYLGRDNFLGVPASRITEPKGRGYWCLPMQSPGDLCYLDEVESLVLTGRAALGERGGR
ncbi:hypothetical protein [Streptomyces pluripotens]|uniref:hypothetical protein n=1 Tax=Streptomyces pluripotens TaxID=1355015 RepID=UPI0006940BD4|nr:hypothetical protein [Streptomyces pluripotens]